MQAGRGAGDPAPGCPPGRWLSSGPLRWPRALGQEVALGDQPWEPPSQGRGSIPPRALRGPEGTCRPPAPACSKNQVENPPQSRSRLHPGTARARENGRKHEWERKLRVSAVQELCGAWLRLRPCSRTQSPRAHGGFTSSRGCSSR